MLAVQPVTAEEVFALVESAIAEERQRLDSIVEEYNAWKHRALAAEEKLRAVSAHSDSVWFWQGRGDRPDSISCPVVMSADTMREFVSASNRLKTLVEAAHKVSMRQSAMTASNQLKADDWARFYEAVAASAAAKYSGAPCRKCGEYRVIVSLEDESDGCGTYYEIECEACGDHYRTYGPDA